MARHWRSRLNSSAAPLVLAKAAPDVVSGRAAKEPGDWGCAELLALAQRRADEAVKAGVDAVVQRVMGTGFCAGKTSLIDGEPRFEIVEDFHDRS